ncbi:uncharacterized protein [Drosophila bipectinata]|uniref:uncharacterized protein isoform X2 n=1 Tax=Drosophila bipectinata TaxID=42026 RepID=UPI001C8ABCE3|nr:uncharacterized protein LOC108124657 [Drosophila bipectinata]
MVKKGLKKSNSDHKPSVEVISEDEWMARTLKYVQRLQDLHTSSNLVKESKEECKELLFQQLMAQKWKTYVSCDGLPDAEQPSDIRSFLFQLRTEEKIDRKDDINWVLSVDERSILSQSPERQDFTRQTLLETTRPEIGKFYDNTILRLLETLKRVQQTLREEATILGMPVSRVFEMTKMPTELYAEIVTFFDKLSYRVICSPEAYMTTKGCMLADYCYKATNFNFQLWGLQDVPVRFNYMTLPLLHADLNCVGVTVQLPLSVLHDNLTLRCIHFFFDPYSHLTKSYVLPGDHTRTPLCGIIEIEDSAVTEWAAQVDIQEEIMMKMATQMNIYQEAIENIEPDKPTKGADNRKVKEKTPKPSSKLPKKPQELPNGMVPDPYKIFLEKERQECDEFVSETFHPDNINLLPFEVNLRRYIMMGGIFSMIFLRKPKHTAFQKFNITMHEDNRTLHFEQLHADIGLDDESSRDDSKRNLDFSMIPEPNLHLNNEDLPYYILTFKMPLHLCRWGEPMVCQFIEEEIGGPVDELEEPTEDIEKKHKKKAQKKTRKTIDDLKSEKRATKTKSISGSVTSTQPSPRLKSVNRLTVRENSLNIYRPSALDMLRRSTSFPIVPADFVKNFYLKQECLKKKEIQILQRYCMPLLLSSFKFPQEFRDEALADEQAKKPVGPMYRRRLIEDDTEKKAAANVYTFNYEDQAEPERLYPFFRRTADIIMEDTELKPIDSQLNQGDDITLYQLMNTLEKIKDNYEDSPKKIANQTPPLGVKIPRRHYSETPVVSSRTLRAASTTRRNTSLALAFKGDATSTTTMGVESEKDMEMDLDFDLATGEGTARKSRIPLLTPSAPPIFKKRDEVMKVRHWTTEYILESNFDQEHKILTVKTDRLGDFGFAYPRYIHFPFRDWELEQSDSNPDEVIFTLDSQFVRVVFFISNKGIRGYVIDIPKEYIAKPFRYLDIAEPIVDFVELRKRFQDMNLNVFAELDASCYIDQGYFSIKHLAAELHVYDIMSIHCKLMKFYRSDWNRLATNRDLVLRMRNLKDMHDGSEVTARVTPESATFVEVSEVCTDNVEIIKLHYQPTWRNIGSYTDLHQMINSMYPHATDMRNRDSKQMFYLHQLLREIRPLSFS